MYTHMCAYISLSLYTYIYIIYIYIYTHTYMYYEPALRRQQIVHMIKYRRAPSGARERRDNFWSDLFFEVNFWSDPFLNQVPPRPQRRTKAPGQFFSSIVIHDAYNMITYKDNNIVTHTHRSFLAPPKATFPGAARKKGTRRGIPSMSEQPGAGLLSVRGLCLVCIRRRVTSVMDRYQ